MTDHPIDTNSHPMIGQLAEAIITTWDAHLTLSPYTLPEDLGYVEGKLEGEKVKIFNRCYQTREFRKLHLELAQVGASLRILHCVMFPRTTYDLPLFGCDIVGGRGRVSAAIADLSPVRQELPDLYRQSLTPLAQTLKRFSHPRQLPTWGHIFSPYCMFVQPMDRAEEDLFLETTLAYLTLHCQMAIAAQPKPDEEEQIRAGQENYCNHQQENDKTRRVLEKAFGESWANRYINTVLFDPPIPLIYR